MRPMYAGHSGGRQCAKPPGVEASFISSYVAPHPPIMLNRKSCRQIARRSVTDRPAITLQLGFAAGDRAAGDGVQAKL